MIGRLLSRVALWLAVTAMVAGLVHLSTILLLPRVAGRDAFARIAALAPPGRLTILPPVTDAGFPLPFEDAASVLAVCRYDLAQGALRVALSVRGGRVVLVSLHARHGATFYAISDRAASRDRLDLVVLSAAQRDALEATDGEDDVPQDVRITAPEPEGFVLIRALADQPSDLAAARDALAAVACTVAPAP